MSDTLHTIAALMQSDAEALRLIGQNIANAESVAYRREIPVAHASFDDVVSKLSSLDDAPAARVQSAIDLRAGTLQSTASPLDLAIEGRGFFVIAAAEGEAFTRRGDFRLDSQGLLVTQAGDPVMGVAGAIRIGSGTPSIAADGTVRSGEEIVGRLRMVEIESDAQLQPTQNGSYTLGDGQPIESTASRVQQGFLETSNVESVNEMIRLMETMRRFEAAQKFARSYDDLLDQAITTLGKL